MSRTAVMFRIPVIAVIAALLTVSTKPAHARSERAVPYAYDQVWSAAIRFLRVDAGFEITERDREAGYVLFAVKEEGESFRGSLELVRIKDEDSRPEVKLLMHVEDRPSYMELGLLERLERKLRSELGHPRPPASSKERDTAPDKAR